MGAQSPYTPLLLSTESGIETTASGLPPQAAAAINRPQPPGRRKVGQRRQRGLWLQAAEAQRGRGAERSRPDSGSPASAPSGTTQPAGTLEEPLQVRDLPWGVGSNKEGAWAARIGSQAAPGFPVPRAPL